MMESLIEYIKTKMTVASIEYDINYARIFGRIQEPIGTTINEIDTYAQRLGLTVLYGQEHNQHKLTIGIISTSTDKPKPWLHLLLFIATFITTLWAGAQYEGGQPLSRITDLTSGIPFSLSLLAILSGHELGHYFVSRKMRMNTTLPYFIPVPPIFFLSLGTFGALIKTQSIIPDRKALIRVGLSGPVIGFLIAVPITIIGLMTSRIQPAPIDGMYLRLGDSLIFYLLGKIIHPAIPAGMDIYLNSMAFAGWIGLFITGLNLLPIGQLDGGHVIYGIMFKKRKIIYLPLAAGILICGILLWSGWLFWGALAFFLSRRDPLIKNSISPLSAKDKLLALVFLLLLILTFTPQPFNLVSR